MPSHEVQTLSRDSQTGITERLGTLRDEAQQLSKERRMNQVKAALCDAIKRRSQDLVAK